LVAFVSTHPSWNGLPVVIQGISDNQGNHWSVLTGPTQFAGSLFTLQSAIYYVHGPATSANYTVTVQLSNGAPLVFHVFAVAGADVTQPPLHTAITDPGPGGVAAAVTTAAVSVPANTLLLSWVKNETTANASALAGYVLDTQSTSFLWPESQTVVNAGSYTGQFQYDSPIGWQTALVGFTPFDGPVAFGQSLETSFGASVPVILGASSPQHLPLTFTVLTNPTNGTLSGSAPNITYTPNHSYVGPDTFTFKANDGGTDSNTATVTINVQGVVNVVGSVGYLNGTPLTTHTSAGFNSTGASTLVAFVSTHPSWNGLPVVIQGLNDNLGNTWNVLTGPTQWVGSSLTLQSAIYFVNSPASGPNHTVTVQLSNGAPLVFHVFAVAGSDVTGPPIYSAIGDPGPGGVSTSVTTAAISVPNDTLLLSWVKNETNANATAVDGYTLDPQSTSFLWAESETAILAGGYPGQFQYDAPIGWQAAVVGLKPPGAVASPTLTSTPGNPTNQASASFSFSDTQAGVGYLCQIDGGAFSLCVSPVTYSGLTDGSHTFSVQAQDAGGNLSSTTTYSWVIITTAPPAPVITSSPNNPTNQPTANFSFSDTETGVGFLCQLDGGAFSACSSPTTYSGLGLGTHTFSIEAQDLASNLSVPSSFSWVIDATNPTIVSSVGYDSSTPLATHTSAAFNTTGASTLVAFVSTHPSWNSQPVSILSLNDNEGNNWTQLTGPTTWVGSSFTLMSAIYYVNSPAVGANHTVTVQLSNAAPLVLHVFAVTASDVTGAPVYSAITDPGPGGSSANVASAPISVPTNTLLLAWVKNETSATATAVGGFTLDSQSIGFIWAESETASAANSFTSQFQYDSTIGWQTAIVGLKPPGAVSAPTINSTPANPTNQTSASFSFSDTQSGLSFLCQLDGSAFGACSSPAIYSGLAQGNHTFAVEAQDAVGNLSSTTSYSWVINTTLPPAPGIVSTPNNPTNQTSANFSFNDTQAGVSFLCQLDGSAFGTCASPATYFSLSQGSHTFSVEAQDTAGNVSGVTSFSWVVDTTPPPAPVITSKPNNPTSQTNASLGFSDTETGATFLCQLDGSAFSSCTSPASYSGLAQGSHTFSVEAQDAAGNASAATIFSWLIDTTPPPAPAITSTPNNPTNQASASLGFSDTETGATFLCQLDGNAFSSCTSPASYSGLVQGSHTFSVEAQDAAGNTSPAAGFTWVIDTTPPPAPAITSSPANPTNQITASFSFSDNEAGVILLCQLDASAFASCSSPKQYTGLAQGTHTFSVEAQDAAGNVSGATSATWVIDTTAPPVPAINSKPANPTNQTSATFTFSDTQAGVSFLCQLDTGGFSACSSPITYNSLAQGNHTFSVRAQDAAGNVSGARSYSWAIDTAPPPAPLITSNPSNPTNLASANFAFSDTQTGVTFLCQLDGSSFAKCGTPKKYTGLVAGNHTFSVEAQDAAGNQSNATSFSWTIDTTPPPVPAITSTLSSPTNQTSASFSFGDTEAGVSFVCQLDGSGFTSCTSPTTYSGLSAAKHTFSVKAQDAAGNRSTAASFAWTVDLTPPPAPTITSTPTNPTKNTTATFRFKDTQGGVTFLCQLDGSAFASCSSPTTYSGLVVGSHTFSVLVQDAAGNQSTAATYPWTITN
jgi:hypothetical protein